MIFIKTFQKVLKLDLILNTYLILNKIDRYLKENKKIKIVKIKKSTKKCVIKRKLKFKKYKNCSGETQLENEISHLEKKSN